MFASKISILSLFVFCLFTLGQAAPTLDSESSLLPRGLFKHKSKSDPATDKLIKHVAEVAHCKALNILLHSKQEYQLAEKEMTAEKNKLIAGGKKSKDHVVKEYANEAKMFSGLAKKAASKIKENEKALKKLGITNADAHCKSAVKSSTEPEATATSSHHTSSHPTPTSHAN